MNNTEFNEVLNKALNDLQYIPVPDLSLSDSLLALSSEYFLQVNRWKNEKSLKLLQTCLSQLVTMEAQYKALMYGIDPTKTLDFVHNRIIDVLRAKGDGYSLGNDRLHNFKQAYKICGGLNSVMCCRAFKLKHDTSIHDIIYSSQVPAKLEVVNEKFGDAINYIILEMAIVTEGDWR